MTNSFKTKVCFVREVIVEGIRHVDDNDYARTIVVTDKYDNQLRIELKGNSESSLLFKGLRD